MSKINFTEKAKKYLEKEPLARKVENRAIACWNLVKIHINPNLATLDKPAFVKYFDKFQSFDRAIRKAQQDWPELSDPDNELKKQILEQEKQIELGYGQ